MSDQKTNLCKEFIKHLLGHGGSHTDVFEIEMVHIVERIMAHLPPPHHIYHVPLNGYIIIIYM